MILVCLIGSSASRLPSYILVCFIFLLFISLDQVLFFSPLWQHRHQFFVFILTHLSIIIKLLKVFEYTALIFYILVVQETWDAQPEVEWNWFFVTLSLYFYSKVTWHISINSFHTKVAVLEVNDTEVVLLIVLVNHHFPAENLIDLFLSVVKLDCLDLGNTILFESS